MRSARVLAVGALAVIACGWPAVATAADESAGRESTRRESVSRESGSSGSEIGVSPDVAFPGSTITVSTTACGDEVAYAKGQAEYAGQINLTETAHKGELAGDFTVPDDVEDGVYDITVKCPPGTRVETSFEVARRPNGAVHGGFGGATGLNGTEVVIGSALLAGASAIGVIAMRRRADSGSA
ncbi:hypothetical protein ABZ532_17070 [Streptomyces sp. NPDC019396]|uniref:hypothetical protein n=1 Tax=Streptomyces sp. NPDC019396 TaxID=3154687 RepID=UPI0033E104B9